jgi:hypothetical protein
MHFLLRFALAMTTLASGVISHSVRDAIMRFADSMVL